MRGRQIRKGREHEWQSKEGLAAYLDSPPQRTVVGMGEREHPFWRAGRQWKLASAPSWTYPGNADALDAATKAARGDGMRRDYLIPYYREHLAAIDPNKLARPSDFNITSVTETITERVIEQPQPCVPRYEK